jgi:hypothetical protein
MEGCGRISIRHLFRPGESAEAEKKIGLGDKGYAKKDENMLLSKNVISRLSASADQPGLIDYRNSGTDLHACWKTRN